MTRIGTVIETRGGRAVISTSRRGVCDECGSRAGCALDQAQGTDIRETVLAANPIDARPGDTVEFDLAGHTELKVSLILWVVPLLGLIGGALAGAALHPALALSRDPSTLLGALAGLALAFAFVLLCERRAKKDRRLEPRILKIVNAAFCPVAPEREAGPPPP